MHCGFAACQIQVQSLFGNVDDLLAYQWGSLVLSWWFERTLLQDQLRGFCHFILPFKADQVYVDEQ